MGDAITFENLYELVRNEKQNDEIQELNPKVYNQLVNYLKTKIKSYKDAKIKKLIPAEVERLKTQIVSSRKLIKELYERRERKILLLGLNKSRTKSDVITDANLLNDEKELFNEVTVLLNKSRKDVLLNLVNARLPNGEEEPKKEPKKEEKQETNVKTSEVTTLKIKFTKPVDKFLGKNLEHLGPYSPGDTAELDKDIANVIINKEHAVLY